MDNLGDVLIEDLDEGIDTVKASIDFSLGENLENLTLIGAAINGTGNELANTLLGTSGNNVLIGLGGDDYLDGGAGDDALEGGTGNDTYFVTDAGDVVTEFVDEGIDTVGTSIDYSLGTDLENLTLYGDAIQGTGNGLANVLLGSAGDNVLSGLEGDDYLDGGAGVDAMLGGTGNDVYVVDNAADVITELAQEGVDTAYTYSDYSLSANVENLTLLDGAYQGTGNGLANVIIGTAGDNYLSGLGNHDYIDGGSGVDVLLGGKGSDSLIIADTAGDTINGGSGWDALSISGVDQEITLGVNAISHIEGIYFGVDSNGTLNLTAADVLATSDNGALNVDMAGVNRLNIDEGWLDTGSNGDFEVFQKDGATLNVSTASVANLYTATHVVHDAETAANVGSFLTSGNDTILIDFDAGLYSDVGIGQIDLTGFGANDKLIIATNDGGLNTTANFYTPDRSYYIYEFTSTTHISPSYPDMSALQNYKYDRVAWATGATAANLVSSNVTRQYTTATDGSIVVTTHNAQGVIQLVGLPSGLSDSQIVFV